MQIGLDMDEVVVSLMDGLIEYYHERFNTRLRKENFFSYNLWEVWGGTKEEAIRILNDFYDSPFFEEILPVEGSIEAIDHLVNENDLHIITSRPSAIKEKTERCIERHFDNKFKTITFTRPHILSEGNLSKADVCKDLDIDVFIEDYGKYALECASKGIKTILFGDWSWNRDCPHHPNMQRAKNWKEALEYFK